MDSSKKRKLTQNTVQVIKKQKNEEDEEDDQKEDTILGSEFYSQDVVTLAKELLGKIIVRQFPEGEVRCMIVETEAYKAPEDKACHAYNNKKTDRTKYFWFDGGHLYVFSIYGMNLNYFELLGANYCINITAATKNDPEAVLIRAVEPVKGVEIIRSMRKTASKKIEDLTNGPGKAGNSLGIDLSWNGFDLRKGEKIYLVDNDQEYEIETSKRINIDYAEEWKDKLWRFTLKGNKFVSKVKKQQ